MAGGLERGGKRAARGRGILKGPKWALICGELIRDFLPPAVAVDVPDFQNRQARPPFPARFPPGTPNARADAPLLATICAPEDRPRPRTSDHMLALGSRRRSSRAPAAWTPNSPRPRRRSPTRYRLSSLICVPARASLVAAVASTFAPRRPRGPPTIYASALHRRTPARPRGLDAHSAPSFFSEHRRSMEGFHSRLIHAVAALFGHLSK